MVSMSWPGTNLITTISGNKVGIFYKMLPPTKCFIKMLVLAFDKNCIDVYNDNHKGKMLETTLKKI